MRALPQLQLLLFCLLLTPTDGWRKETDVDINAHFDIHSKTVEKIETSDDGNDQMEDQASAKPEQRKIINNNYFFNQPDLCKLMDIPNQNVSVFSVNMKSFQVVPDNTGLGLVSFKICVNQSHLPSTSSDDCNLGESPWSGLHFIDYKDLQFHFEEAAISSATGMVIVPNPFTICTPLALDKSSSKFTLQISVKNWATDDPIADFEVCVCKLLLIKCQSFINKKTWWVVRK